MQGVINGKDVIFAVKNGGDYVPYLCAKDLTIETIATLIQVATIGDGAHDKFKYQSIGYSINMSGVIKINPDAFSAFNLLFLQLSFLELQYKITFVDQDGINSKIIKGTCLVERNSISGSAGSMALNDVTLRGSGAFSVIECDAQIEALIETDLNGDGTVRVTVIDGFPASFFYQLDSNIEVESTDLTYTFLSPPEGYHTVRVTPACASGKRGETIVIDFSNVANPVNPTCGVPDGFSVTNITDNAMTVNWAAGLNNTSYNLLFKNVNTGAITPYNNITGTTKTVTGLIAGASYEISLQANCGVEKSAVVSQVKTTTSTGPRPTLYINNYSSAITVLSVVVDGVTIRSTPVSPSTNVAESISLGFKSIVQVVVNRTGSADASIAVAVSGKRSCHSVPLLANPITETYGDFSVTTDGMEINIEDSACIG